MELILTETEARVLGVADRKRHHHARVLSALPELAGECVQSEIESRSRHAARRERRARRARRPSAKSAGRTRPAAPTAASPNTSTAPRKSSISRAPKPPCSVCYYCAGRKLQANCAGAPSACIHFETLDDVQSTLAQADAAATAARQTSCRGNRGQKSRATCICCPVT